MFPQLYSKAVKKVFRALPWQWLVRVLTLGRWKVFRIDEETSFSRPHPLLPQKFTLTRAWWVEDGLRNLDLSPAIRLSYREFADVFVSANRRGGFLANRKSLIVPTTGLPAPPKVFFPNTEVAGILDQSGDKALLRQPKPVLQLPRGIFTGSMAPHNWFHWTIDNLPTIFMAQFLPGKYDDFPLLVPEVVFRRPHWLEPLELASGGREILSTPGEGWVQVERLVRIEGVTRPNPRSLLTIQKARIAVFGEALEMYRDHMLEELELADCKMVTGRKVFLARRDSEVRRFNQDEIILLAKAEGFEDVYLDELDFREAVMLFCQAEFIIGPHSAAWANLLYSHPGAKAMMWTWPGEKEDNWYENIAHISGVRYLQIFTSNDSSADSRNGDRRLADYVLEPAYFRESLSRLSGL